MSQQISFVVDDNTLRAFDDLKKIFGVNSNAAVVRRAVALARIAASNAGEDNTLTIVDRMNKTHKVILAG